MSCNARQPLIGRDNTRRTMPTAADLRGAIDAANTGTANAAQQTTTPTYRLRVRFRLSCREPG
jgi:hypothetical protein